MFLIIPFVLYVNVGPERAALADCPSVLSLETGPMHPPPTDRTKDTRPDRAGKRVIAGHFEEAEFRRFKVLIAQRGWTTDAGVRYAIYEMFKSLESEADDGESSS